MRFLHHAPARAAEGGTSRDQEGLPQRHRVHREEILNPKLEIPDNIENIKFKHLYFDIV
jgi:hypothetical protein